MQDHGLPAGPELGRELDRLRLGQVESAEAPSGRLDGDGPSSRVVGLHHRLAQHAIDVGLHRAEIGEAELHRHIEARAEEVHDTTPIEQRRPLVLGCVDSGCGHTRRIG